uniref:Tyrosine-protein phosphatase domain-containing protein n=1 Tax=Biomphalaria glabrata TaxID=6526 RepID=A0A2C9KXB9_BIOGL
MMETSQTYGTSLAASRSRRARRSILGNMMEQRKLGNMMEQRKLGNMMEQTKLGNMMEQTKLGNMMEQTKLGNMMEQTKLGNMMEQTKLGSEVTGLQLSAVRNPSERDSYRDSPKTETPRGKWLVTNTLDGLQAQIYKGLRRQDQHILSELPKPTAVKDFWRLVVQYKVALVIAFEVDDVVTDSTIGCYQPLNTDYPFYCANYKIRSEFVCYSKFWDEHKMEVHVNYTKTGKPPLLHTLSHVKARKVWPLPESIAALLRQARSHRLQENERILYMCRSVNSV